MALKMNLLVAAVAVLAGITLVESTLYQYCDLNPSGVYKDPLILDEELFSDQPRQYPSAAIAQALERSPETKALLAGKREAMSRNRAAAAARSANRTKRAVGAEYLAESRFTNLCSSREKRISYSLDYDNSLCSIVEPSDLFYNDCGQNQCNVQNEFPNYQQYRCEPDTYIYMSATAYCELPDGYGEFREQVFYVPINCCCRRYNCNMSKKYDTPRLL